MSTNGSDYRSRARPTGKDGKKQPYGETQQISNDMHKLRSEPFKDTIQLSPER